MRFLPQRAKWREEGDTREPVRRGKPVGRSKAIHEHLATCTQDKCSQKHCEVQQDWHNVTMAPGIAQPCSQKWFKMVQELGIQKSVMGKFNGWPSSRLFFFWTTSRAPPLGSPSVEFRCWAPRPPGCPWRIALTSAPHRRHSRQRRSRAPQRESSARLPQHSFICYKVLGAPVR